MFRFWLIPDEFMPLIMEYIEGKKWMDIAIQFNKYNVVPDGCMSCGDTMEDLIEWIEYGVENKFLTNDIEQRKREV